MPRHARSYPLECLLVQFNHPRPQIRISIRLESNLPRCPHGSPDNDPAPELLCSVPRANRRIGYRRTAMRVFDPTPKSCFHKCNCVGNAMSAVVRIVNEIVILDVDILDALENPRKEENLAALRRW